MKMRAAERLYELWNLPTSVVERSQCVGYENCKRCWLKVLKLPDRYSVIVKSNVTNRYA